MLTCLRHPALAGVLCSLALSCSTATNNRQTDSGLSSFTLGRFQQAAEDPSWASVKVTMQRGDGDKAVVERSYQLGDFQSGSAKSLSLMVPMGTYRIHLSYLDGSGQVVFRECDQVSANDYQIQTKIFNVSIPVCKVEGPAAAKAAGNVTTAAPATSSVAITPTSSSNNSTGGGGNTTSPQTQSTSPATGDFSAALQPGPVDAVCMQASYGLPAGAVPGKQLTLPASGDLSSLPSLGVDATPSMIKGYVAKVYDLFPQFAAVYEQDLGLSRKQALAFMYADMSRESGGDSTTLKQVVWKVDLLTGSDSALSWGPLQAAVTNFHGGGYEAAISSRTGLPVPAIDHFKDPATSTYAGMKRLAEGILGALGSFGPGHPAQLYLLGTLADHNTGYANAAQHSDWVQSYGAEVLRLMQGYLQGDNLSNDKVFWTTQPSAQLCQ